MLKFIGAPEARGGRVLMGGEKVHVIIMDLKL